jgi:hypothetical protein
MTDWQPISTAPTEDGVLHVRGVWVYSHSTGKPLYFDVCAGWLEGGDFISPDGEDHGWRPEDYTHWCPLSEEPEPEAKR